MARPTFTPAGEMLIAHLSETGGTLTPLRNGRMLKLGFGEWDMARTWHGREIVRYKVVRSLWDKGIHITFFGAVHASEVQLPTFKLELKPPLTEEEIEQTAQTYMMILNLRREE